MVNKFILSLAFALALAGGAWAEVIRLSPGDDPGAVVAAAPEGAVFRFAPGIYANAAIIPKDHQTFIGEEGAVLSGAIEISGWQRAQGIWSADFPEPGWSHGEGRDGMARFTEDLLFDGRPLRRVAGPAELGPGTFFYRAGRAYTRDDPTGRTTRALYTPAAFGGGSTGVTIENLVIRDYASPAQRGAIDAHDTRDWTLIDVEAVGNHGAGLAAGDGTRVIGGVYSDNGQVGIHAYGATGLRIEGVVAKGNNYAGFAPSWDAGGIKILTSTDVVVRDSEIAGNEGVGLWLDWDNREVLVENNHIHDNAGVGVFLEASYATAILGNNVADNNRDGYETGFWGADILVTSSAGTRIEGNLVYSSTGQGIGLEMAPREDGAFGPHRLADATVSGNTIVMAAPGLNGVFVGADPAAVMGMRWVENTYVTADPGLLGFTWDGAMFPLLSERGVDEGSVMVTTADVAAWRRDGLLRAAR